MERYIDPTPLTSLPHPLTPAAHTTASPITPAPIPHSPDALALPPSHIFPAQPSAQPPSHSQEMLLDIFLVDALQQPEHTLEQPHHTLDTITPQHQPVDYGPEPFASDVTTYADEQAPLEVPNFQLPQSSCDNNMIFTECQVVVRHPECEETIPSTLSKPSQKGVSRKQPRNRRSTRVCKTPIITHARSIPNEASPMNIVRSPALRGSPMNIVKSPGRRSKLEVEICPRPKDCTWVIDDDIEALENEVGKVPDDALDYALSEHKRNAFEEAKKQKKMLRDEKKRSVGVMPTDKRLAARAASRMEAGLSRDHKELYRKAVELELRKVLKVKMLLQALLRREGGVKRLRLE